MVESQGDLGNSAGAGQLNARTPTEKPSKDPVHPIVKRGQKSLAKTKESPRS